MKHAFIRVLGKTGSAGFALIWAIASCGCGPSSDNIHRWETTLQGPDHLRALVISHSANWALREEAAISLIRMGPRMGRLVGLDILVTGCETSSGHVPGALSDLTEDDRRHLLNNLAPRLVGGLSRPPPPRAPESEAITQDASIAFARAALGILSHDPPFALDDATKGALNQALVTWIVPRAGDIGSYPDLFQIIRFLGVPGVKSLPSTITSESKNVSTTCHLIADFGDDETKKTAGAALVALAKEVDSPTWLDKKQPVVEKADRQSGLTVTPLQLRGQLTQYQQEQLLRVFSFMKIIGGSSIADYATIVAADPSKNEQIRAAARIVAGQDTAHDLPVRTLRVRR